MHVRATANTGASREDICEAFLHVAIYAGVPAANRAIKVAKEVFAEMDAQRLAMAADRLSNREPETGAFFQRDRAWHPPALTPGYKSSVLRSPQRALLSFDNTLSEITGPVFGHGMLGELDNDLIRNFAKPGESAIGERIIVYGRVLDERGAAFPACCWRSGRPMPAAATGTSARPTSPRSIRISAAAAAPSPMRMAAMPCAPSSPGLIPGRTAPTTGARRISISRCSAMALRSG